MSYTFVIPSIAQEKGGPAACRDVVTHRRDAKKTRYDSMIHSLVVIPCSSRALLAQPYERTGIPFFYLYFVPSFFYDPGNFQFRVC